MFQPEQNVPFIILTRGTNHFELNFKEELKEIPNCQNVPLRSQREPGSSKQQRPKQSSSCLPGVKEKTAWGGKAEIQGEVLLGDYQLHLHQEDSVMVGEDLFIL